MVLEKTDSALAKILMPARLGIFPFLGTGRQYMPWIHIDDLVNIYFKAIEDEKMSGAYNAVSPQHITQSEFMSTLALAMNKRFFHPWVPAIFLRAALGKMADVALKGSRVSGKKIHNTGHKFNYPVLSKALTEILSDS